MHSTRHAVIIGAGSIGSALIGDLPETWGITVIDIDASALENLGTRHEKLTLTKIVGDASSRLVLEKAQLEASTVVAVTTKSDKVNKEIVRICREHFGVEEIVSLFQDASKLDDADLHAANVIVADKVLALHMRNRVSGTEKLGVGIGLGEGELRQVTVLPSSPAVGMTLEDIQPSAWLVAAVYRGNRLIVPHGDTMLEPGDRVLLVGQPEVLRNEADFVRGGQTIFPNQYGAHLVIGQNTGVSEEASWFLERCRARKLVSLQQAQLDLDLVGEETLSATLAKEEAGCLVLPFEPVPFLARIGLFRSTRKRLMLAANAPVIVTRGSQPYERILMTVFDEENANTVTGVAVDVARQCGAKLTSLHILPPSLVDGETDEEDRKILPNKIAKIARNHGLEIDRIEDEGNPIEVIRRHAADFDLLIMSLSPQRRNSVFKPDISMYFIHDSPCSVLFVPTQTPAH